MKSIRALIVEDELLIAETVKLYLEERGHQVVGMAISYDEAIKAAKQTEPDIILLDIRLYGQKSGIDVANYLKQSNNPTPYIIVSSQFDTEYVEKAMNVGASGYITKPISKETLWSTVELAVLKSENNAENGKYIDLKISHGIQRIKLNDIIYIKSDHVYVEIVCTDSTYYGRYSLKEMIVYLEEPFFCRTHRSYIVNINKIDKYSSTKIWIEGAEIPISAKYKDSFTNAMSVTS